MENLKTKIMMVTAKSIASIALVISSTVVTTIAVTSTLDRYAVTPILDINESTTENLDTNVIEQIKISLKTI